MMKRIIFITTTLIISIIMSVFGKENKAVDFNFPKDVIKSSEEQLNQALKSGDGESLIDAIVKISLAKSSISDEYFDEVIKKIDDVLAKENRTDIKAILLYLKSIIYRSHEDVAEANKAYVEALMAKDELQKTKVAQYTQIIKSDELGRRLCPSLYDFLRYKQEGTSYIEEILEDGEMQGYKYAVNYQSQKDYDALKEYVEKYPESPWANDVRNKLTELTEQKVYINFQGQVHSECPIELELQSTNAKDVKIILYKFPSSAEEGANKTYSRNELKKVLTKDASFEKDELFFSETKTVTLDPLPEGYYYVNLQVNGVETTIDNYLSLNRALLVKNTSYYTVNDPKKQEYRYINVDIKSGAFVEETTKEKPRFTPREARDMKALSILTDLGIYRPGETLHYTIIYQYANTKESKVLSNEKVYVDFKDARGKKIASDTLITDKFGQIAGEFAVPKDRMNGRFSLSAYTLNEGGSNDCYEQKSINVSEYKTPTFYVKVDQNRKSYDEGTDVTLKGHCKTYSGIGVANREVKVEIENRPWFFFHSSSANIVKYVTTDDKGDFTVTVGKDEFSFGRFFAASFIVTDEAGETQEGRHEFFVGKIRGIRFSGTTDFINDKNINLPIYFTSSDENETSALLNYSIALKSDPDKILQQGVLNSANTEIDLTSLKSSEYILKAKLVDEKDSDNEEIKETIVLYKNGEKTCPTESALWLPKCGQYVDDKNTAHITIGSAYPVHIFYIANSRNGYEKEGWLDYQPGIHDFKIQIPEGEHQHISVEFRTFYECKPYNSNAYLNSETATPSISLGISSFRDKIVPGAKETWTFTLTDADKKPISGRLALRVISEAVNQLSPSSWGMVTQIPSELSTELDTKYLRNIYANGSWSDKRYKSAEYQLPELNLYDRYFYWGSDMEIMACEDMVMSAPRNYRAKGNVALQYSMASQAKEFEPNVEENEAALNNVSVREAETKVALWEPIIDFGENGDVSVEFNTPADNTTWRFNALAFNLAAKKDNINRTMVASRPIMVKPSVPRFLREGDETTLMANVQNGGDEEINATAVIELFNPRTNEIISRENIDITIPAGSMKAIGIAFKVPSNIDNLPFIGFRVKAAANGVADGEQVLIPVLSAVMPVVETVPFYLNPNEGNGKIDLSHLPENAELTYEYCNNPVWYCVSALPTIYDSNILTATGLAHNLYAVSLAKGLADSNPLIAETLRKLQEDEKEGKSEKGTSLPFDEATYKKIIENLCKLQNEDGGISWFDWDKRESSEYVTHQVLELLGEIRMLGYEIDDKDLIKLQKKALKYYEKKQIDKEKEMKKATKWWQRSNIDYTSFSTYLYLRTLYPVSRFEMQGGCDAILSKTLKAVGKNWRNFSIPSRTFVALSLYRNNKVETAKLIMESMRQFAINDPRRGMFWDNLQVFGYRWFSRTSLTAAMLEAFNEIDPREDEIEQIRKWILLQKQTTDWGSSSMAAEATYALLSTGKQWLNSSDSEYTKKPIAAVKELNIEHKPGSPSWGAVYAKFPTVISETKAFALPEIKLEKKLILDDGKLTVQNSEEAKSIKIGDKIQVQLTITTDRDMSYVTIKDHRASCFEPVDKFSGYRFSDSNIKYRQSVGYYNDTKDTETRIMINFLPKGSHIMTYDVYVTNSGTFCTGLAEVECELAPQFTSHTEGSVINIQK